MCWHCCSPKDVTRTSFTVQMCGSRRAGRRALLPVHKRLTATNTPRSLVMSSGHVLHDLTFLTSLSRSRHTLHRLIHRSSARHARARRLKGKNGRSEARGPPPECSFADIRVVLRGYRTASSKKLQTFAVLLMAVIGPIQPR